MPKAILHTEIDREVDSPLAPEEVQQKLRHVSFRLQFQDYDGDTIPFYHRTDDVYLEGIIQRWQGTESHVEVSAKVTVPASSRGIIQVMILAILLALLAVTTFALPATASLSDLFTDCTTIQNEEGCGGATLSAAFPVIVLVVSWIAGIFGIIAARSYDPFAKKRWQAQQAMGAKVDEVISAVEND